MTGSGLPEGPSDVAETLPERPSVLAADAPPGDTYGREQAARVLGVSPRRVSQLVDDGRLVVVQAKPLRVSAQSVHELRDARRNPGRDVRATVPPDDPSTALAAHIASIVEGVRSDARRVLEAGESVAERLRDDLLAERERAEREAERLRAEIAAERARADAERAERERVERERAALAADVAAERARADALERSRRAPWRRP